MTLKINNTQIPKFNPPADLGKTQKLSPSLAQDTLQGSSKKIRKYSSCNWFVDGIKRVFEKFLSFLRCIFCCECPKKAASDETKPSTIDATKPDPNKKPGTSTIIKPPIKPPKIKDPNEPLSAFEKMPLVIQNLVGEYLDGEDRLKLALSFNDLSKKTYEDLVKDLGKREILSSDELQFLMDKLKNLSEVFSGPVGPNAGCEIVLDHCKNLKKFVFNRPFDAELLKSIALHLAPSASVSFKWTDLTDEELNIFSQNCPKLKGIHLGFCSNTDTGLRALATNCKELKNLHLSSSNQEFDDGLPQPVTTVSAPVSAIGSSTTVKRPSNRKKITNEGLLEVITNCKQLEKLSLSTCPIDDKGLHKIATNCPQLQSLRLGSCHNFSNAGLQALTANCKMLQKLFISHCSGISDAGLQAIAENCQQLEDLTLEHLYHQITLAGLQDLLARCKKLKKLSLARCDFITDDRMRDLTANCKQLEELSLDGGDLITDTGLQALATNCTKLKKLTLKWCNITDASLQALATNCTELQEIDLSFCYNYTDAGMEELKRNLPNVRIINRRQIAL